MKRSFHEHSSALRTSKRREPRSWSRRATPDARHARRKMFTALWQLPHLKDLTDRKIRLLLEAHFGLAEGDLHSPEKASEDNLRCAIECNQRVVEEYLR